MEDKTKDLAWFSLSQKDIAEIYKFSFGGYAEFVTLDSFFGPHTVLLKFAYSATKKIMEDENPTVPIVPGGTQSLRVDSYTKTIEVLLYPSPLDHGVRLMLLSYNDTNAFLHDAARFSQAYVKDIRNGQ